MSTAATVFFELTISELGRPLTTNACDKLHPIARSLRRHEWRDATTVLAREAKLPPLDALSLVVQPRYRTRRSPADCDACAPSVKGVLDGLVQASVIPDDCPPFVLSVCYLMPVLGTGEPDCLRVEIHPESVE